MAITTEQAEQIRAKLIEQIEKLPAEKTTGLKEQVLSATPEQLEAYLQPPQPQCLFCGISQGKIETYKIYEDSDIVIFLDITPLTPGQVIITPKEHYEFLFQIPDQVLWSMTKLMKILTPIIVNVTSTQGVSTYFAQGGAAGQVVDHLSINMVPRVEGDKATFSWERKQVDKESLEKISKSLSEGLEKTFKEEREAMEKIMKEKAEKNKPKSANPEQDLKKVSYPRP